MKKSIKAIMAVVLCFVMLIGTVAIGGDGFVQVLDSISVKASATTYSVGDTLYYGNYPQTKVTDSSIISALNSKAGNNSGWTSYGYYSGTGYDDDGQMTAKDYMRYTDVTYNGEKYRGVYFDTYRPYYTGYEISTSTDYTEQDDNGYYYGNVYWFKYEPIKWRVLDPSTGYIMCDTAIDSQAYNNYVLYDDNDYEYHGDSDCTYYASNYAKSSIRQWLNNDFYNTAFNETQKANIKYTTLDNSSAYSSTYDAPSTTDKVFLISYVDSINSSYGFSSSYSAEDTARQLKSTDYAKCQGCYQNTYNSYLGNCWWWLRSPYDSRNASGVDDGGHSSGDDNVDYTDVGVVPALKLSNLKSEISQSEDPVTPDPVTPDPVTPDPVVEIPTANLIAGKPSGGSKTYDYKTAVTFTASVPEGGSVQWYVDDKAAGNGETLSVGAKTDNYTVKVVVTDANGNQTCDTENITIKHSFWDKIVYFFKHLFNPNAYVVTQK